MSPSNSIPHYICCWQSLVNWDSSGALDPTGFLKEYRKPICRKEGKFYLFSGSMSPPPKKKGYFWNRIKLGTGRNKAPEMSAHCLLLLKSHNDSTSAGVEWPHTSTNHIIAIFTDSLSSTITVVAKQTPQPKKYIKPPIKKYGKNLVFFLPY